MQGGFAARKRTRELTIVSLHHFTRLVRHRIGSSCQPQQSSRSIQSKDSRPDWWMMTMSTNGRSPFLGECWLSSLGPEGAAGRQGDTDPRTRGATRDRWSEIDAGCSQGALQLSVELSEVPCCSHLALPLATRSRAREHLARRSSPFVLAALQEPGVASSRSIMSVVLTRPTSCRPADTLYEGAFLRATLSFPQDFPLNPPKMKFISEMWHPNSECRPLASCGLRAERDRAETGRRADLPNPRQSTRTEKSASPSW